MKRNGEKKGRKLWKRFKGKGGKSERKKPDKQHNNYDITENTSLFKIYLVAAAAQYGVNTKPFRNRDFGIPENHSGNHYPQMKTWKSGELFSVQPKITPRKQGLFIH